MVSKSLFVAPYLYNGGATEPDHTPMLNEERHAQDDIITYLVNDQFLFDRQVAQPALHVDLPEEMESGSIVLSSVDEDLPENGSENLEEPVKDMFLHNWCYILNPPSAVLPCL